VENFALKHDGDTPALSFLRSFMPWNSVENVSENDATFNAFAEHVREEMQRERHQE